MQTRIAVSLLTLLLAAGCGSGDIPTPVPSNTPTPSAQDTEPTGGTGTETPAEEPSDQPETRVNPPSNAPATDKSATADKPVISPTPFSPDERFLPPPTENASPPSTTADASPLDSTQLVAKLADANDRDVVTRQLVAQGSAAVEPLLGALKSDNWEIRASAIFCLGQLGAAAKPALPELKEVAKSDAVAAVRDTANFAIDTLEGQSNQP